MDSRKSHDFWDSLDRLVASHEVVIDRPKGTAHPRYPDFIYPLDYGYLRGVASSDGNDMDVWRGTAPDTRVCGVACVSDETKGDVEMKILVACTDADLHAIELAQNTAGMHAVILRR